MKRVLFLCAATSGFSAIYGCSQADAPAARQSGAGGASLTSGGSTASGGAGTTGASATAGGGGIASGGSIAGAAGGFFATPSGGSAGTTAGSTSAGAGGTGSGGSGGASGALTAGGGNANTAGAPGGAGGNAGAAGAPASVGGATAGAAAGGSGGAAAGGSGSGELSAMELVPDLQGFYWEGSCVGERMPNGHSCPLDDEGASCPSGGITREKTIPVKGVSGQLYTINIEVRGVVGTRCYRDGKRASTAALSEDGYNDWWQAGGTLYNPTGWWNTYELHVSPATGDPSGDVYYFNSSGEGGGNDCEREASYLIKYTASFKAKGGGSLTFRLHDQNCQAQQNCGANPDGSQPCMPRTVDLSGMPAQPPAGFMQPPVNGTKPWWPQWLLIAVTSITSP